MPTAWPAASGEDGRNPWHIQSDHHSHWAESAAQEPNLQNIPVRMELGREIRKVFVPEEGCVFVDADYSQIELRVLAHMSGDESLIEAYRHAQDIHCFDGIPGISHAPGRGDASPETKCQSGTTLGSSMESARLD